MTKLVIFDLDGTLVDSLPDLTDAVNHFMMMTGRKALGMGDVRKLVGQGARYLVEHALHDADASEVDHCLNLFLSYNEKHLVERSRLYPGVLETLGELKDQGATIALVSNKVEHLCRKLLSLLKIDEYFYVILGGDSLPTRKPSPDPIVKVLQDLSIPPSNAVMIGDSINDMVAGKAAGVATVGCRFGYGQPEELKQADFIINDLPALLQLPCFR
ncbi:HAD-IIIA family hydrolase [Geobacter sp. DSM 9736]|uniref:HAD-IIIA family hydrolase n=1 Tax=Geobacter sp. DSM 9736 TaxID=1277350 RepID=UPI000B50B268|nr:HAD-IIIA family hydrolase [Geobacter sp. DSM 9736]SNB45740.1 phosphoglycolate phosphatase [Geobacter sp. DSM 9736]